jgi:hypothetical protein
MWISLALALLVHRPSPTDDAARLAAFRALPPETRSELVSAFRARARELEGLQPELIRKATALDPRAPGSWPELAPPPVYDPEVHAPGAAARHRLDERSPTVVALRKRMLGKDVASERSPSFVYDHGSGELRRAPDFDAPERIFLDGLAGLAPDLDLALALVTRALDDASQRKVLGALAHAYTSREGEVYPGLTLYDALSSREEIEMPDVDCLGVIHDVFDDWTTWTAPVPQNRHAALYDRIKDLFVDARVHRSVRAALAMVFLHGDAQLEPRMRPHLARFHALWASLDNDPNALGARLPEAAAWRDWISEEGRRLDTDVGLWEAGVERRATLVEDAARVRALLDDLLGEMPQREK